MTYSGSLLNKDTQIRRLMLAGVMLLCNVILNYSGLTLNFFDMLHFRDYDLQSQHIVTCWMSWPSILTIRWWLSISRNFHFTSLSKMNRLELCSLNMMSKSHMHLKFPIFVFKQTVIWVCVVLVCFFVILKAKTQQPLDYDMQLILLRNWNEYFGVFAWERRDLKQKWFGY